MNKIALIAAALVLSSPVMAREPAHESPKSDPGVIEANRINDGLVVALVNSGNGVVCAVALAGLSYAVKGIDCNWEHYVAPQKDGDE